MRLSLLPVVVIYTCIFVGLLCLTGHFAYNFIRAREWLLAAIFGTVHLVCWSFILAAAGRYYGF